MWSTETAGTIDLTAEVTIFTKAGAIKLNLKKDVDVSRLDRVVNNVNSVNNNTKHQNPHH